MGARGTRLLLVVAGLAAALVVSGTALGDRRQVKPVKLAISSDVQEGGVVADGSKLLVIEPFSAESSGSITRLNLSGSLDRSFGDQGNVAMRAEGVTVADDGKLLVSTTSNPSESATKTSARVMRLLPNGHPDRSFGVGGHADIDFGKRYDYAETAELAANGDILVGGIRVNSSVNRGESDYSLAVARLKPDGSLDRSFGRDGVRILPGGGEVAVRDIALTPSGAIIVEGGNEIETFLWKLNRDGSIDRHFGRDGFLVPRDHRRVSGILEELTYAPGIAVLPSGKLLLAADGFLYQGKGGRNRVVAVRLRPDGRQDRSYGKHGWATAGSGIDWTLAHGLTLLSHGVLAVAASFEDESADEHREFGVIAFSPDGRLEDRFGRHGRCRARLPGRHEAVAITEIDARPVVVGDGYLGTYLLNCSPLRRR